MSIEKELQKRSGSVCELCSSTENLGMMPVSPKAADAANFCAYICGTCKSQIREESDLDPNHWRCLNESMWSEHEPIQVLAFRQLTKLKATDWAKDLLEMMYMEEDTREWANMGLVDEITHLDSNGSVLKTGDSVTLIQDLKVKGSTMVIKRGTAVRRIRVDLSNSEYVEGKVNGQNIVIIAKYTRKSNK